MEIVHFREILSTLPFSHNEAISGLYLWKEIKRDILYKGKNASEVRSIVFFLDKSTDYKKLIKVWSATRESFFGRKHAISFFFDSFFIAINICTLYAPAIKQRFIL